MLFFTKSTAVRGQAPTPVKAPAVLLSREPLSTPTSDNPLPSLPLPIPQHPHSDEPPSPLHPLLKSLRQAIDGLPVDIPEATVSDALAVFSAPPFADPDNDKGPFRAIDSALNHVIGFGTSPESLKTLILHGHFGMDGLFSYLKSCIEDIKIEPVLLEGKIERLIEAMVLWYALIYLLSDKF